MFQLELSGRCLAFKLVGPADPYYAAACALARGVYRQAYGATIAPSPHRFIVCIDRGTDQAIACAGLSFGGAAPLFSEYYLDRPLAALLGEVFQREVAHRDVAEVTALATLEPSIGTELVRAIPLICWYLGLRGILCTVTGKLRRGFANLKLPFHPLAVADATRLPNMPGIDWGTYYETRPVTGVIRLDALGQFFDTVSCRYNQHWLADDPADRAGDMTTLLHELRDARTGQQDEVTA